MQKYETLKQRSKFVNIAKNGKRFFGKTFLMQVLSQDNSNQKFCVGYVASRKVGNAVRRNKAKRRLRELVRSYQDHFVNGVDYVLVARSTMWDTPFADIEVDFKKVISKVMKEYA